ncbi:hypothetical protein Tco_0544729, partial [Tanacetum coccineum]
DDDGVGGCRLWGQRGGDDGDDDGCGGDGMKRLRLAGGGWP